MQRSGIANELILFTQHKDIKLLIKIINTILNNPNLDKYKNLNIKRISNKLIDPKICIRLLCNAGFHKSDNGTRLVYDHEDNQLKKLKLLYQILYTNSIDLDITQSTKDQINSQHLLYPWSCPDEFVYNNIPCDLDTCLPLTTIGKVLKLYDSYMKRKKMHNAVDDNKEDIYDIIYDEIGNNYNNIDLLNDFNHLLFCHDKQFEDIYNILSVSVYDNKPCNLLHCLLIKRHQRNRSQITKNERLLNELYFGDTDLVEQQLLDRIHCHYFHTFDVGYKLTENEKQNIMVNDTKMQENDLNDTISLNITKRIQIKQRMRKNIVGLERINSTMTKFVNNGIENQMHLYRYGYRFFYWKRYKGISDFRDRGLDNDWICNPYPHANENYTLDDLYIVKKYANFKDELLLNEICYIGEQQWIPLMQKATIYVDAEEVKELYCPRQASAKYFEMKYGDIMQENHLIAMMVYCNFNVLQYKFSQTFRKINEYEHISSLKARHSHYYFLGRYLRECVECFGDNRITNVAMNVILYRGIDKEFTFSSMSAYIKCPFSTTTDIGVATNFCQNEGMILELNLTVAGWTYSTIEGVDAVDRLSCFDCKWISDFSNEAEIFCIGGLNLLRFTTIIKPDGTNFVKYIKGIKHATFGMSSGRTIAATSEIAFYQIDRSPVPSTKQELQLLYRLLSLELYRYLPDHPLAHPFGCPEYIKDILHLHCMDIKVITFHNVIQKTHDIFLKDNNDWIDWDIMTTLFPNVTHIKYNATGKGGITFLAQSRIFESILEFIQNHKQSLISNIIITEFHIIYKDEISQHINNYLSQFINHNWGIFVTTVWTNNDIGNDTWTHIGNEEYWNRVFSEREKRDQTQKVKIEVMKLKPMRRLN